MKIVKYNDFRNISGKKLRELRISAKLSQQDLAEKLQLEGIDLTSKEISKIENNKRLVQDFELSAIAKVLDTTETELLKDFRKKLDSDNSNVK